MEKNMEKNVRSTVNHYKAIVANNPAAANYIAKALGTKPEQINGKLTPVVDLQENKLYAGLTEMAVALNMNRSTLKNKCVNDDYRFKFVTSLTNKQLKKICEDQKTKATKAQNKALAAKGIKTVSIRFDPYNEYNSNHIETLAYNEPEKIVILNNIFKNDNPKYWAKSTMIMNNGKISPVMTHWERTNNCIDLDITRRHNYENERKAIKKSCIYHAPAVTKTPQPYTGLEFAFMTQLPIEVLEGIYNEMIEHGCKDWVAYNAYKEKHPTVYKGIIGRKSMTKKAVEERRMKAENEKLKIHVADLEAKLAKLEKGGVK